VTSGVTAAAWAEQQVTAVRDDPAGRLALMQRCYYGPFGKAPRHLPYRWAAMSFMRSRSSVFSARSARHVASASCLRAVSSICAWLRSSRALLS